MRQALFVQLHMDETIIPYELHIDEANDPEEIKCTIDKILHDTVF